MPNEVLVKVGGQWVFADHAGDYVGGTGNDSLEIAGSTDVQLAPGALAAGAARQSAQADFGATRGQTFGVMMSLEMASDPVARESVDVYLAPSPDSSAAVGNPGGCTGSDSAYAGYSASTLAEGLVDLMYVGSMALAVMNDLDGVQISYLGTVAVPERYGSVVVVNGSAAALFHSDDVEFSIVFNEIIDEVQ